MRMMRNKDKSNSPAKSLLTSQDNQFDEEDDQTLYQANPFQGMGD